jgi:hypothetical protein
MVINIVLIVSQINENNFLYFSLLASFIVLYLTNKFFFMIYKTLPTEITSDNEKIVCTKFIFNKSRREVIYYKDIKTISGGIFDGRLSGMMKFTDKNNLSIAFSHRISDSTKLIAKILEKVDKKIYLEVIENMNKLSKKLSK